MNEQALVNFMTDPPPLPRRIGWFAPWTWFRHWTRWKRGALFAVLVLAGYIEAPVILDPLVSQTSSPLMDTFEYCLEIVFYPISYAYDRLSIVKRFYDPQLTLVEAFFRNLDR